jgi:hypothetical protein
MPTIKIYPNNAVRQAAYRARKRHDGNLARQWAERRLKALGYEFYNWHCVFQWSPSGKTLWASNMEDGWCLLCDPDAGTVRKLRST